MADIELWQQLSRQPESLLKMPPQEAERIFNKLNLEQQASLVLLSPWEKRQELILLSNKARELVQAMPTEELFWTIKAIGVQDCLELLRMARADQLQFMFDLDWWYKDKIVPEKIVAWLLLLFEASENVVARWLDWILRKDETLLPTIMRPFLTVYKRPDDMDIQEARDVLPAFTMDDTYFIEFKNKKLEPLWARIIEILIDFFPSGYRDLMESLLVDIPAETFEFAYRWRNSRLADWGIPEYFEAIDIYAPLNKTQLRRIKVNVDNIDSSQELVMPAFVPTLYIEDMPYLRGAIDVLAGSSVMTRIIREWVWVANKLLIADLVDLDDPSQLKQVIFRTAGLINLALEDLYKETGEPPEAILKQVSLEDIVRVANTFIRKLKSEALKLIDNNMVHPEGWYLEEEVQNKFLGLLTRQVLYWDPKIQDYRGFKSIDEILEITQLLNNLKIWAKAITIIQPHWDKWHRGIFDNTNIGTARELTWRMALVTFLAQISLNNIYELKPLNSKEILRLRTKWLDKNYKLRSEVINNLIDLLYNKELGIDKNEFSELIYSTLKPLESFFYSLKDKKEIDPRFVEHLWTIVDKAYYEN